DRVGSVLKTAGVLPVGLSGATNVRVIVPVVRVGTMTVVATVVRVVMTTVVGVLRVGSCGVRSAGRGVSAAAAVSAATTVSGLGRSAGTTIVVVAPGVVSVGTTGGMTVRGGSYVMTAGVVTVVGSGATTV
ncbi:hypothetical protein PUR32_04200, partial [Streptomyces sp. BE133]